MRSFLTSKKSILIAIVAVAATIASVVSPHSLLGSHNVSGGTCVPVPPSGRPLFNIWPLTYSGEVCHDFPLIDARNVTQGGAFSQSQGDHDNGVSANPNDTVRVLIFFHNGTIDLPENTAHNTQIRASVPSGQSTNFDLRGFISASNADTASSNQRSVSIPGFGTADRGGDIRISTNEQARLEYVPGSTKKFTSGLANQTPLPDGVVAGGVGIGDVKGCFEFSGFVTFDLRVVGAQQQPGDLAIQKDVRNVSVGGAFADSVQGQPGQTVEFRLRISSSGVAPIPNVIVRDSISDSRLQAVSGSVTVDGSPVSDSQFFGNGVNVGTLTPPQSKTVLFRATIAQASSFSPGTTTLVNTGFVRGDNVSEKSDQASVIVTIQQEQQGDLAIQKDVRNVTSGGGFDPSAVQAQPGQTVEFRITVSALSNRVTNVTVRDFISDSRLQAVSGSVTVDGNGVSDSQFFGSGVNIGTVNVGSPRTILFRATVASESSFSTGTTVLENTAFARGDNVSEKSDKASVIVNRGQQVKNPLPPGSRPS